MPGNTFIAFDMIHVSKKFSPGFTLVELMVVIMIFATISGLLLANFNQNQKTLQLRAAAQEIVEKIRLAQALTISNASQKFCPDSRMCGAAGNCCEASPPCNPGYCTTAIPRPVSPYGIAFDISGTAEQYAVFADGEGGGACSAYSYCASKAIPAGIVTLPPGIVFDVGTTPLNTPPLAAPTTYPDNPIVFPVKRFIMEFDVVYTQEPFSTCTTCQTVIVLRSVATGQTRTIRFRKATGAITLE